MNVLEVRAVDVVIDHLGCPPIPSVDLWVDGTALLDLVQPAEKAAQRAVGNADGPSGYLPMAVYDVRGPEHYLGSPIKYWGDEGATALLGCNCGTWDCSPLTARVYPGEIGVCWSVFRSANRKWNPLPLGPFIFDRAQYEAAFDAIDWKRASGR